MTEPVLRPFAPQDLTQFVDRDYGVMPSEIVLAQALQGPAFTGWVEGRPFCAGGIVIPWKGIGLVWFTTSPVIARYGLSVTRTVRQILRDAMTHLRLVRLEAAVYADNARNRRWIEALGFRPEQHGRAVQYFPGGADAIRYELTRGGTSCQC